MIIICPDRLGTHACRETAIFIDNYLFSIIIIMMMIISIILSLS
eukprot:COSAG06_NODE_3133_length_5805_cov_7.795654_6_plen_43_part_01